MNKTYLALAILNIDLVAQDDEGEVLGIMGTGLDEELIAPAIQGLEGFGAVHVIDQHAAVSPAVECYTK